MNAADLPGMDFASLSYPTVASRKRLILDGPSWEQAGLGQDDEAMAWAAGLERGASGAIVSFELVAEGEMRYRQFVSAPWTACNCGPRATCRNRCWGWLTVHRRYTGPIPRQVLAAFRMETS